MRKGLAWYTLCFAAYAVTMQGEDVFLHLLPLAMLLSFPLAVLAVKKGDAESLGLVKGQSRHGLPLALIMPALLILVLYLRGVTPAPLEAKIMLAATLILSFGAVSEELFFRGYMQPKLQGRLGRHGGLLATAALFALAHLPKALSSDPSFLLAGLALGLLFGLVRDVGESVYYPMICHVGYNGAWLLFSGTTF